MSNFLNRNEIELFLRRKKYFYNEFSHWEYTPEAGRQGILEISWIYLLNEKFLENIRKEKKPIFKKENLQILYFLIDPTNYYWYSKWRLRTTTSTISGLTDSQFSLFLYYKKSEAWRILRRFVGKYFFNFSKNNKLRGVNFFKKKQFFSLQSAKLRMLLIYRYRGLPIDSMKKESMFKNKIYELQGIWQLTRFRRRYKIYYHIFNYLLKFLIKLKLWKLHLSAFKLGEYFDGLSIFYYLFILLRLKLTKLFWLNQNFKEIKNWQSYYLGWIKFYYIKKTPVFISPRIVKQNKLFSPWRFFFRKNLTTYLNLTRDYNIFLNKRRIKRRPLWIFKFIKPYGSNRKWGMTKTGRGFRNLRKIIVL